LELSYIVYKLLFQHNKLKCANDSNNNRPNVFITIKEGTTGEKQKNNSTENSFKNVFYSVVLKQKKHV